MPAKELKIRVVLKSDNGNWIAQGLEFDITAQGKDIHQAKESFVKTVLGYLVYASKKNIQPFLGVPKAPDRFWKAFNKGEELLNPILFDHAKAKRLGLSDEIKMPYSLEARVG